MAPSQACATARACAERSQGKRRPGIELRKHQSGVPTGLTVGQGHTVRVANARRRDKRARFTALMHHVTIGSLRESFDALRAYPRNTIRVNLAACPPVPARDRHPILK